MRKKDSIAEEIKIGVITSLSSTFIWFALGSLWSLIAANLVSLLQSQNILPWQYFVAGISVGAAMVVSIKLYFDNKNKFRPRFPSLSMDYMYKKIETEMYFKTREEITYNAAYDIMALKEISGMKRSFGWTGTTINEIPNITSSKGYHKVELCKDDIRKTVNIIFEQPLLKNQETDFQLKYELGDSERIMQPILGHTVKNPTEKIVLRLCVPTGMIKSVKKCIYADGLAEISLSQPQVMKPRTIGNIDVYEWEIINPSLLYYYRINWDFS